MRKQTNHVEGHSTKYKSREKTRKDWGTITDQRGQADVRTEIPGPDWILEWKQNTSEKLVKYK